MSKNVVLLSDGTGNSSSKLFTTNVWRLYQALDLGNPAQQIAYYDDGVGTSSFKPFAILGGVFGFGLKRNVIDIYSFCCRNYRHGDKIYGFGFSRGAFTIRVVAGFIARVGLVRYDGNDADLARDAEIAYRGYRKARNFKSGANILIGPLRALRDWVSHTIFRKPSFQQLDLIEVEKIDFLGVWDTVDAYGGPIEEITRAIDYWYWPLSMPDLFMNRKIGRACHALALEEERDSFHPVLWDDRYVRKDRELLCHVGDVRRHPDHDRGRYARRAALAPAVDVPAHAPGEPAQQHTDAVLRLHHAAVIAEIVHPGLGVLGDPMAGRGVGRVVESRRRDRDRQPAEPVARLAELRAADHHLLAGRIADHHRGDLIRQGVAPDLLDLVEIAAHAERIDVGRARERAHQHRDVVAAAASVDHVLEQEGLALALRQAAETAGAPADAARYPCSPGW